MKTIKKFTAIQISSKTVDDKVQVKLQYGDITGPYYSRDYPTEEFDSESDALEYAYKTNSYAKWLIVPVISFEFEI